MKNMIDVLDEGREHEERRENTDLQEIKADIVTDIFRQFRANHCISIQERSDVIDPPVTCEIDFSSLYIGSESQLSESVSGNTRGQQLKGCASMI
jgi:hypothetical protein